MRLNTTFHVFGKAINKNNWKIVPQPNVDVFNCVISGHAAYIYNSMEYPMLPGHIYLFLHTADYMRILKNGVPFEHVFFDFMSIP